MKGVWPLGTVCEPGMTFMTVKVWPLWSLFVIPCKGGVASVVSVSVNHSEKGLASVIFVSVSPKESIIDY